jgi:hypothetical protein
MTGVEPGHTLQELMTGNSPGTLAGELQDVKYFIGYVMPHYAQVKVRTGATLELEPQGPGRIDQRYLIGRRPLPQFVPAPSILEFLILNPRIPKSKNVGFLDPKP